MAKIYIGALDIGGTKVAASIADESGPLFRLTEPTVKSGPAEALGKQAIRLLEGACAQAGIEASKLDRVGVCSCGPFVHVDGMIALSTPNICGGRVQRADVPNDWTAIPLERVLRKRFGHVAIENDCVAALVAERTFGAARDEANCVYVTWSTGVGFGLCVDGHVLRGKQGNAGHAGHLLMSEVSDALCGCGNRGDLEAMISGRNIGIPLDMTAEQLFTAARAGHSPARDAALNAARWLGKGLYNLAATLDSRMFIIGGSVWAHHGDWLRPAVLHEIESRLPALTEGVVVKGAGLGNLVADVGAFSLAIPAEWIDPWRSSEPWLRLKTLPAAPAQAG